MPKYGSFGDGPRYSMNPDRHPGFFPRIDQIMWEEAVARQGNPRTAEGAGRQPAPAAATAPSVAEAKSAQDVIAETAVAAAIGLAGGLLVGLAVDEEFRKSVTGGLKRLWNGL